MVTIMAQIDIVFYFLVCIVCLLNKVAEREPGFKERKYEREKNPNSCGTVVSNFYLLVNNVQSRYYSVAWVFAVHYAK